MSSTGTTAAVVDALLERLRALVAQLAAIRAELAPIQSGIALARAEFEDRLRLLNQERRGLRLEIEARGRAGRSVDDVPGAGPPDPPDRPAHDPHPLPHGDIGPPVDDEAITKDMLLEHLFSVLDPELDTGAQRTLAAVNGRLQDDAGAGLADLLEEMPWGDGWTRRAPQESLDEQYRRLAAWEAALIAQRDTLRRFARHLREHDPGHRLYELRAAGRERWGAYLEQEARAARRTIDELQAELDELGGAGALDGPDIAGRDADAEPDA